MDSKLSWVNFLIISSASFGVMVFLTNLLFDLIKSKTIAYVNGVVRAGKESVVFWAVSPDNNDIALKVYLVTTAIFKKRATYILGDPRFSRIKKGTRNLVYLWAKKRLLFARCQIFDIVLLTNSDGRFMQVPMESVIPSVKYGRNIVRN